MNPTLNSMEQIQKKASEVRDMEPFPQEFWEYVKNGIIQECRVIFMGNADSGKTSLIKRILRNELPEPNTESTTGINSSWGFTTARGQKDSIKAACCLRFMDFGGQMAQTDVHRCFMTEKTIYVVVCDWEKAQGTQRSENELDLISRWLYEVRLYSPDSPVLIALNKSDLVALNQPDLVNDKARANKLRDDIRNQAQKINVRTRNVLITSAKTENRMEAVGQLMEAIRKTIPECLKKPSKNWLSVRSALEERKRHCISQEEYLKICRRQWVLFPFQQKRLLIWLENQGAFYCSPVEAENNRLEGKARFKFSNSLTLLQSDWLTRCVYHMIRYYDEKTPEVDYVLQHSDIMRILHCLNGLTTEKADTITPFELWEKINKDPSTQATPEEELEKERLLSVMRRLDLSFLLGDHEEIVPSRMKKGIRNIEDADRHQRWVVNNISVKDKSHTSYSPPFHISILHYLMCRNASKFQEGNRNYACFAYDTSTAEVTLEGSELHLYFRGNTGADGKLSSKDIRDLKKIRDDIRDYLKKHKISATEYLYDENDTASYSIEELQLKAKRPLSAGTKTTGRDMMNRYGLPIPASQKATRFLTTAALVMIVAIVIIWFWQSFQRKAHSALVMVVMIVIIWFWRFFQRKAPSVETGKEISESAPIATSPVNADSPVSEPGHESTSAEANEKSETSAEERLTETKRILLILGVAAVSILVVVLVLLRFINPEAYKKVIEVLQGISSAIPWPK